MKLLLFIFVISGDTVILIVLTCYYLLFKVNDLSKLTINVN